MSDLEGGFCFGSVALLLVLRCHAAVSCFAFGCSYMMQSCLYRVGIFHSVSLVAHRLLISRSMIVTCVVMVCGRVQNVYLLRWRSRLVCVGWRSFFASMGSAYRCSEWCILRGSSQCSFIWIFIISSMAGDCLFKLWQFIWLVQLSVICPK